MPQPSGSLLFAATISSINLSKVCNVISWPFVLHSIKHASWIFVPGSRRGCCRNLETPRPGAIAVDQRCFVYSGLFVTQSDHGVNFRRAQRGNIAGYESDHEQ